MNSLTNNPLISIIVPVYNVENYLKKCLDSLLSQTYQNLEIIAVDDGSPDNCGVILDEYAKKDDRVKVIHKENGGVSSARNVGLDNANGEYVIMVDSDDYVSCDFISSLYNNLVEYNTDISVCNYFQLDEDEEPKNLMEEKFILMDKMKMISVMLFHYPFTGSLWNKLIKADLVRNVRFNVKLKHFEDYDFLYRVFKKADSLIFTYKQMYFYVNRQGSVARSNFSIHQAVRIDVINNIYEDIKQNYPQIEEEGFLSKVKNYLALADKIKQAKYKDKKLKKSIKNAVRKNLKRFLRCKIPFGYKLKAIKLTLGFWCYR